MRLAVPCRLATWVDGGADPALTGLTDGLSCGVSFRLSHAAVAGAPPGVE